MNGIGLAAAVGRPDAFIENDTYLMALAESRIGAARNSNSAIILMVGTGIGGALMFDREIYRGVHGFAGEIGNMLLKDSNTDQWHRFELMASTTAVISKC